MKLATPDHFICVEVNHRSSASGVSSGSRIASALNAVNGCVMALTAISRSQASVA